MIEEAQLSIFNLSIESLSGEVWRPVLGLESYAAISNFGRVKRLKRAMTANTGAKRVYDDRIMKSTVITHYVYSTGQYHYQLYTTVSVNRVHHTFYPARMVYYLFKSNFPIEDPEYVIGFINGNELDLHPENLTLQHIPNLKSLRLSTLRKFNVGEKIRLFNKAEFNNAIIHRKGIVSCYNSKGTLVRSFKDIQMAQRDTGHNATEIEDAISKPFTRLDNLFWRSGKKISIDVSVILLREKQKHNEQNGRKITQFDLNGVPVNFFDSIEEAEENTRIPYTEIIDCLKNITAHAGYFLWREGHWNTQIEGL